MPVVQPRVELLAHTPEPLSLVYAAFRQCYHAGFVADMWSRLLAGDIGREKQAQFVASIMESGHASPVEHVSFTFALGGVSRALTHQLVRHRIASFNQQSQRYVKFTGDVAVVKPESIAGNAEASEAFDKAIQAAVDAYHALLEAGVPAADARYLLPNAAESKIVITMNVRELLHFFSLRCCNRAQWEIRDMAHRMLELARPTAPFIFADAGAPCVRGTCPEGKMTCGNPYPKVTRE